MASDPGFTLAALWALRQDRTLSELEWKVAVVLVMFADEHGCCRPSLATIARVARSSRTRVRGALHVIERGKGPLALVVSRDRVTHAGDADSHEYRLSLKQAGSVPRDPTPVRTDPTLGPLGPDGSVPRDPTGRSPGTHKEDNRRGQGKRTLKKDMSAAADPVPSLPLKLENPEPAALADDEVVFDHWAILWRLVDPKRREGKTPQKTEKRMKPIRARLADGISAEDLCTAVDNVAKRPFYLGHNERGTAYIEPHIIFRDVGTVEGHVSWKEPTVTYTRTPAGQPNTGAVRKEQYQ